MNLKDISYAFTLQFMSKGHGLSCICLTIKMAIFMSQMELLNLAGISLT